MAREGAQLGVPSIYAGSRQMKANAPLYQKQLMRQVTRPSEILDLTRDTVTSEEHQIRVRSELSDAWEDPTDAVIDAIYRLCND